jgi:O-acetyl-ADP-ribose deacetylase (regulator of RNase III)
MIKILEKSNLLNIKQGIICHQTNCIGVMGGGIALQIRNKWPNVYKQYVNECESFKNNPKYLLGHVQDIVINDKLVISNCFGQIFPGYGLMTNYAAWDKILDKLRDLQNYFHLDLHFPWMIGCGLAGGDWNIMFKKFCDIFENSSDIIFIHKL